MDCSKDLSLFLNYRRLKEIKRCNNFSVLHKEDDAQHSYYVTIYSIFFANEYNKNVTEYNNSIVNGKKLELFDINILTKKALYHDIEEAFTSDIPHNVKHHSEEANKLIKSVVDEKMSEIFSNTGVSNKEIQYWNSNDKNGLEGKLIAIVDLLELAIYSAEEVSQGNTSMMPMVTKCVRIINKNELFDKLKEFSPTFNELINNLEAGEDSLKTMVNNAVNID